MSGINSRLMVDDLLIHDGGRMGVTIEGCTVVVLGQDFETGDPQPVTQTIESLLQDGSLVDVDHYDNRTPTFWVGFKAGTDRGAGVSLARAEATLWGALTKAGAELVWVPPAPDAAACCFPIVMANLTKSGAPSGLDADLDEMRNGARWYKVTLTCLPFVFAAETVTVTAGGVTASAVTTVISDGTSATGWSNGGYGSGDYATVVSDGTRLVVGGQYTVPVKGAGSTEFAFSHSLVGYDLVTTPYLTFDVSGQARSALSGGALPGTWTAYGIRPDGVWIGSSGTSPRKVTSFSLGSGVVRYVYDLTGVVPELAGDLVIHFTDAASSGNSRSYASEVKALLDNVTLTNTVPRPQGGEQVYSVQVAGSARTPGEVAVTNLSTALGKVALYSAPSLVDGYQPGLMQYATTLGTAVTVAGVGTWLGGNSWCPWAGTVFTVPRSSLPPGPYLLVGHLYNNATTAATQTLTFSAQAKVGGVNVGPASADSSPQFTMASKVDGLVALGGLVLDPLGAGANTGAQIVITLTGGAATLLFDELLLCHVPDGSFGPVLIDCGAGTPALGTAHSVLKVKTANLARPQPQTLVGVTSIDEQMLSAAGWAQAWDQPELTPGEVDFLVASTGGGTVQLAATYRPAFLYHPY